MTKTTGIERMKQARARLILNQVFWGTAAIALRFKPDETVRMAYTDGRVIGFNPAYIDSLEIEKVEATVCHEVMHCILLHPLRLQGRDHDTANRAMDYVVNGIMKRAGLHLDDCWLYDDELSAPKMSFEAVYAILIKKKQDEQRKQPQGDPNGSGEDENQGGEPAPNDPGDTNGSGTGEDTPSDSPSDPGDENSEKGGSGDGSGSGTPAEDGKPGSGSASGTGQGDPEPWEVGEVRPATAEDGSPINESEAENLGQDWKITAQRALAASKACGKAPGGMERIIQEILVEKRDLEDVIRDFIIKTLNGDYTWSKPNKRHLIHGIYTPSVQGEVIPEIVMVMDTSGSIGDREVNYFTAKLNNVLAEYNTTVHVVYCDTSCHDGGEYGPSDLPVVLKPLGGGGTDFRPPFKWVQEKDLEPTCMIYVTDGYCRRFPMEPDYPVLWAIYGDERTVPFGEVVMITPE